MERSPVIALTFLLLLAAGPLELSLPSAVGASAAAPGVPANFQISSATTSMIRLSWQPPISGGSSPVTNYTIYRGATLGAESLFKVLGNTNSYVDTALAAGTSYFYQISASNAAVEGRRSYEVAARVGTTFVFTIGATYLETGPLLTSSSSEPFRSTLGGMFVNVSTSYGSQSTTLNLAGLPSGTHLNPSVLPYVEQGSFSLSLTLVTDASSTNTGSFPLTLSAKGPFGDSESLPLTLNVRGLAISPSLVSLYIGQNETMMGAICPNPTSDTWASINVRPWYQRPDGSRVSHNSVISLPSADICAGSLALDQFAPNELGTWYANATVTLQAWDGSTETIATRSSAQTGVPSPYSISFAVSAAPPKSLSVSLSANPASVGSGGTSVVTASVTASDGAKPSATLLWSASGGILNSTSGSPVSWTAPIIQSATNFSISVTASATGYVSGSNSITLLVIPPQPLTPALGGNSTSGIAPLRVQFVGSASGGYPPYSFKWSFGDGASSGLQSPVHVFLTPGNYTATLMVTDARLFNASRSVLIRVLPRPALVVSASATPSNGTAPLAVAFTSVVGGGTPPYSYAWTFGDGGTDTSALPHHTYAVAGDYKATLNVTDSAGTTVRAAIQILVVAPSYTVTFSESGLPGQTQWTITFNGQSYRSNTSSIRVPAVVAGSYLWSAQEVDTCQGCRYTPLQAGGTVNVSGNLSQSVVFQAEYLVSVAATPAGAGTITPAGSSWYASGKVITLSARPNGTFVWGSWAASQTIALGGTSVVGESAQTAATINGPGTITVTFTDAWRGSYIRAYSGNQTWHPRIVEIHISAADSAGPWAKTATTFVGILQQGGQPLVGSVGAAGTVFDFITQAGAIKGNPNSDGSYDFTAIQVAGNAAYVYAGLYSATKLAATPLGAAPSWVGLLSMPPTSDKLVFGDSILPYATAAVIGGTSNLGGAETIVSVTDLQGRLYLTVQDAQGRTSGLGARSNATLTAIPGSYYLEIGSMMAVVLPANVTSFTYSIDASRASQLRENFTVALKALGTSGFAAEQTFAGSANKGSTATYSATLSSGTITNVALYAVSLDAVDSIGLPAVGATATLTSAGGVNVTISQGVTKLVPAGAYVLAMSYEGQSVHETVTISHDGPVSARVLLSTYGIILVAGILTASAVAVFFAQRRRPKKKQRARISEWLK